jgi:hypothetical protein
MSPLEMVYRVLDAVLATQFQEVLVEWQMDCEGKSCFVLQLSTPLRHASAAKSLATTMHVIIGSRGSMKKRK